VIRRVWRRIARFFGSAALAVGLLVFVGVWSLLATLMAQGDASSPVVTAWAASNPLLEPVVRTLGLYQAFTSYVFLGAREVRERRWRGLTA
jgi:O-antigen/teichoic acid export membrane protein